MSEDAKVLLSVVAGGVASVGLGSLSALWLDRVLAPLMRAYDLEILALVSIALIVGGAGYVWYLVAGWTLRRLDG